MYRCVAASVNGFVQQLSCNLVGRGYWHYTTGVIPLRKDPQAVDSKLINLYSLDRSKWSRARQRRRGEASVAYLRFRQFFVLIATPGRHSLFEREGNIRDIRRKPIHFHGY